MPSLSDADECANCAGILEELENIDDDCDRHGIVFVKTKDFSIAETYGVLEYPALVYFESSVPNVFEGKWLIECFLEYSNKNPEPLFSGQLREEEEVLQWLITQKTEDRIELITRAMLETMVEETTYLAVYFCKCFVCVTFPWTQVKTWSEASPRWSPLPHSLPSSL